MDAEQKAGYEAQSQQLRLELKTWETAWARDHAGAKPSRDDIKRNTEIAQKYTTYNKLRNVLSGKTAAPEPHKKEHHRRKRKSNEAPPLAEQLTTPSKRLRSARTPLKESASANMFAGAPAADAVTPSISRKLFSPVVPTSIGPTPQRDGRVLGLFDVLSEEHDNMSGRRRALGVDATPSKCRGAIVGEAVAVDAATTTATANCALLVTTPRKQTLDVHFGGRGDVDDDDDDDLGMGRRRLGRTPMSSAKRNLLDRFTAGSGITRTAATTTTTKAPLFTTPLKARDVNMFSQNQQPMSPGDTPSKEFATPAFLRRAPPPAIPPTVDENGVFLSPPGRLRLPRKPLVRGLSSVLASLRKMEEDELDEQLDVLRDLEEGGPPSRPPARPMAKPSTGPPTEPPTGPSTGPAAGLAKADVPRDRHVQVQDSQRAHEPAPLGAEPEPEPRRLLDGFDDEGLYDSPPEEQNGRDGQPLRVFKKKGQKRTTRFVRMRPTRTKRPAAGSMAEEGDDDNDGDAEKEALFETRVDAAITAEEAAAAAAMAELSGSEFGDEGDEGGQKKASRAKKAAKGTKARKHGKDGKDGKDGKGGTEGTVKKAARKVNELAHANFKRLKLRNKGSKGGPGFNSRFRRRR